MKKYKSRIVDDMLKARLRRKGAVLIEGAKWCGKTTTAEQHASSVFLPWRLIPLPSCDRGSLS